MDSRYLFEQILAELRKKPGEIKYRQLQGTSIDLEMFVPAGEIWEVWACSIADPATTLIINWRPEFLDTAVGHAIIIDGSGNVAQWHPMIQGGAYNVGIWVEDPPGTFTADTVFDDRQFHRGDGVLVFGPGYIWNNAGEKALVMYRRRFDLEQPPGS